MFFLQYKFNVRNIRHRSLVEVVLWKRISFSARVALSDITERSYMFYSQTMIAHGLHFSLRLNPNLLNGG